MRILSCLLIFIIAVSAQAMNVVLDPGHGGNDRGATQGLFTEAEITLQVANLVAIDLKRDPRFSVYLTRETDRYMSLEDRASFANKKSDLFLSIHVNSSSDPRASGKEIYFQNQLLPDEESLFLASRENKTMKSEREVTRAVSLNLKSKKNLNPEVRAIVEDLERNHRFKLSGIFTEKLFFHWGGGSQYRRHSIRQAPFFVVSNIDKPAALIEIGYLSNKKEALNLVNPQYQKKIAKGIYHAIISFKEFIDNQAEKSLN